jgi:hypothetical protein
VRRLSCVFVLLLCARTAAAQYAPIVDGILAAWRTADVVCVGEDHGRKHDSELRIALVRHPKFAETVKLIVIEFANPTYQDVLDRFVVDGAAMSRDEIAVVWREASGAETFESPIYEEFLRAVRDVNLRLPKPARVRVLAGDSPIDWRKITTPQQLAPLMNRGGNIRKLIAEQVLDKHIKALAVYGSGHCEKIGMGFPGELEDRYPGRIWSASTFFGAEGVREGRRLFGLKDQPQLIPITGTPRASMSAGNAFYPGPGSPRTFGEAFDAIVYYGEVADVVVRADTTELRKNYGPELERRSRLQREAFELRQRQR